MPESLAPDLAPKLAVELGLKLDEYEKIVTILGRIPSLTELYMYSLMWSEHCSYKHSRKALRMFPNDGPAVLQGPGENAGVIGVGDGWAVAFKMESHNHPSAIEPYQGAATGVGGIIRDIFTMGARPIASLNSLRFGTLDKPRQRYLFEGSVAGIGGYGNCLGVPTVGGEVYFEEAYEGNCLINAMSLGVMREDEIILAVAAGPGNLVVLIGSTTGRDGIGGASVLASQEFDERAEDKRPAVQVGDPFEEKLLIEACLELLKRRPARRSRRLRSRGTDQLDQRDGEPRRGGRRHRRRQDPGARGRDEAVRVHGERVAGAHGRDRDAREPRSRSRHLREVGPALHRHRQRHRHRPLRRPRGRRASSPTCPLPRSRTTRPSTIPPWSARPTSTRSRRSTRMTELELPTDQTRLGEVLLGLLASPNICSRRWIWEQYDHQVMLNTVVLPGSDAAVLRIGDEGRGIAVSSDCNGRYCYLDPYVGAQIAFAEAARNVSCAGGDPAAITDCLNFGYPEKPEVFWTFYESVRGLSDACKAFGVPVISGNVSFYNESFGQPIYPTPTVGLVGLMDDVHARATVASRTRATSSFLVGESLEELGGSEYLKVEHGTRLRTSARARPRTRARRAGGRARRDPRIPRQERARLLGGRHRGRTRRVLPRRSDRRRHAPRGRPRARRLAVRRDAEPHRRHRLGRDAEEFVEHLIQRNVPYSVIGTVGGERLTICEKLDLSLDDLAEAFEPTLEALVAARSRPRSCTRGSAVLVEASSPARPRPARRVAVLTSFSALRRRAFFVLRPADGRRPLIRVYRCGPWRLVQQLSRSAASMRM